MIGGIVSSGMAGRPIILTTDGGTHPPEKWALAIAEKLIEVDPHAQDRRTAEQAQALQVKLATGKLLDIFATVKREERDRLKSFTGKPADLPTVQLSKAVKEATRAVLAAADGTLFREAFRAPDAIRQIEQVVGKCLASCISNERDWWKANEAASPSD